VTLRAESSLLTSSPKGRKSMFREACDSHESKPHRDKPKLVFIRCIKTEPYACFLRHLFITYNIWRRTNAAYGLQMFSSHIYVAQPFSSLGFNHFHQLGTDLHMKPQEPSDRV
jgi:hypothetical protein